MEAFSGSQADLEGAADNLFSSPPYPQPLRFESLSLKTPQTVPPTSGTALQNKIESRLEKSLGNQFNIQLQQHMGVFQASMLEAMKSLRDEMQSMKKASQAEVDKTSASLSKAGPSKEPDPTMTRTSHPTRASALSDAQPMDTDVYGPPLPPKFTQSVQSDPASKHSDLESDHHLDPHSEDHSEQPKRMCSKAKKHSDKKKHKVWAKYYSQSSSEEDQSSVPIKKSTKPQQKAPSEPEHQQDSTDPVFYREVDMSDLPSQYAEEVETFRQILELPDPRETLPRSSTTVLGLDDEKNQQELRPRGPSAMLPLNSILRDAFEKFEQDFLASNLPAGKYIKPSASTAKCYKVGQPCFEDKIQELNTDFAKICISPKPSGAPMGKVPLQVPKELKHQARQNLSTINFTATFTKTASSCNTVMEKSQHSIKATFKRVKSQIQKGVDPERAVRHGYENACDYFEIMNKRILIQQRTLACLSKPVAHILQRELYTMANTGLLRPPSTTSRGL